MRSVAIRRATIGGNPSTASEAACVSFQLMRTKTFAVAVSGLIALVACSSSSEQGASSGPLEPAALASALAKAYCKAAAPCCGAWKGTIAADCETRIARDLEAKLATALATPKQRYDAALAASCVEAYRAQADSCEAVFTKLRQVVACARVVDGVSPPGAACAEATECATPEARGYVGCGSADGGTANMKCRQFLYVSAGEACSAPAEPFAGAAPTVTDCWSDEGLYCTNGRCTAGAAVGEPCPKNQCAPGAGCDFTTKTCVAAAKEGEACSGSCAERSLSCINGTCERQRLPLPCLGRACAEVDVCTR